MGREGRERTDGMVSVPIVVPSMHRTGNGAFSSIAYLQMRECPPRFMPESSLARVCVRQGGVFVFFSPERAAGCELFCLWCSTVAARVPSAAESVTRQLKTWSSQHTCWIVICWALRVLVVTDNRTVNYSSSAAKLLTLKVSLLCLQEKKIKYLI